jgi:putative oxidoreductase
MRYLVTAARLLLGLIFFVFGLNFFFHFIPQQMPPGPAANFAGALFAAGYFFPMLKTIETLSGLALLANRFVPLAVTVLAPIAIHIFAFHVVLAPVGIPLAAVIVALDVFLAYSYRDVFLPLLNPKAKPTLR